MIFLSRYLVLLGLSSVALAAQLETGFLEGESNQVAAFISQLQLPSTQSQPIIDASKNDTNFIAYLQGQSYSRASLTSLACFFAQLALGNTSLQSPVSVTEVDENWSSAVWQTPSCAILPNNARDVSKSLLIISFLETKFSIRSGGHSPNPGFSSIGQPGILIDMQRLNQITLSLDQNTTSLGPGARWGDVYATLDPFGLSVVGGRIPTVGVGGLLLGGGYFHFSARYGLATDNVQNIEIVLSNGTITNANLQQNADLFWALKGGGPNFGIVTRYDVYTIPVRNIWYSVNVYPNSQVPMVFDAMAEWQNNGASDTLGTVALIVGLETTEVGLLYAQPTYNPSSFAPFYNLTNGTLAIPPTNGTLSALTTLLGASQSQLIERHDYRGASSKISAQLYKDVYATWQASASAVFNATGANQTFVIQPMPASLVQAGKARGGNAMGLPDQNFQAWTTLIDWASNSDAQDAPVRETSIQTTHAWQTLSQQRALDVPSLLLNDASRDQNPLASYGAANVEKLKGVAAKYDSAQVFQRLQSGGFLLSLV